MDDYVKPYLTKQEDNVNNGEKIMKYVVIETNLQKDDTYKNYTTECDTFIEALQEFNSWCGHSFIGSCILVDVENDIIIRQCISPYSGSPILK